MTGAILGLLALALLAQAGFVWMRSIPEVRVAERRPLVLLVIAASLGLGVLALSRGPGWLGGAAAVVSVLGAVLFFALQGLARQSHVAPAIAVDRPLPVFTAPDADGLPFEIASLAGRPFLLKLFRGHW